MKHIESQKKNCTSTHYVLVFQISMEFNGEEEKLKPSLKSRQLGL